VLHYLVVHFWLSLILSLATPVSPKCPYPHWPPIIPPIFAVLISLLMIPCYCYSCGPWSGPYWAEQRDKLMTVHEECQTQRRRMLCAQPQPTNGCFNSAARLRPAANHHRPQCWTIASNVAISDDGPNTITIPSVAWRIYDCNFW